MPQRRESVSQTGLETTRLTFRLKVELPSMDTQRVRIQKLSNRVYLAKNVQEHMLKNYIIYIQHAL
eukprot:2833182-Heterocapsa_arctica.AAC.1